MGIWYATREEVASSLEVGVNAYASALMDAKIEAASRSLEGLLHRRFYPERKTVSFDWPNYSGSPTWELDLGSNELISVETFTSGGTVIPSTDFFLRRSDDKDEPPYTRIEIDLDSSAALSAGPTWQRSAVILGLYGDTDTATDLPSAALGVSVSSSATTWTVNPSSGLYRVGVGALMLIGTERVILRERAMADTTVNTAGVLANNKADRILAVTDGTQFVKGETILVDAERMEINDIAGNNLIVARAHDTSTLDDHASGVDVYALRQFTVERHALGTSAAAHTAGDLLYKHDFPGLVNELCTAEAVVLLEQNASGYARTVGTGTVQRESVGQGLLDLRARTIDMHGRNQVRSEAV